MTDIEGRPGPRPDATHDEDAARLAGLRYTQERSRVLGLFGNFSVAFSYLSPMVGVYSLFILGAGGGAHIWLMPRAMRSALIYGGVVSFVLIAALLLATPASDKGYAAVFSGGGVPGILAELPQWLQDLFLVVVIIAFFSCGTAAQGAGARLAYSFARDGAVPAHRWVGHISPRFRTPVNAIDLGAIVPIAFAPLVNINPSSDIKILWFTYPKGINPLTALVSFGVSGIYLSFLLTVIGSMIARSRGRVPEGVFKLGRWGWLVSWLALAYLAVMLVNVVLPSGLSSPRAFFNVDWITLNVMVVIALVGAVHYFVARPDRALRTHLHDELEPTAAERETG